MLAKIALWAYNNTKKHGRTLMKKILCVILALVCMQGVCLGESSARGSISGKEMFKISYDDAFLACDTQTYLYENGDGYFWQFMLYNEDIYIDCAIEEAGDDVSLYLLDESDIDFYGETLIYAFNDYAAKYTGIRYVTVTNGSKTALLPFVTFELTYEDYPVSYYAETATHGYAIYFLCEREAYAISDEAARELFFSVLDSFEPILN